MNLNYTHIFFSAFLAINCVTISALTPEEEAQAIQKFHQEIFQPDNEKYPTNCHRIESALDLLPEISSTNPYIMEYQAKDGSVRFCNILTAPVQGLHHELLQQMLAKLATPSLKAIAIKAHLLGEKSAYALAQNANVYPNRARHIFDDFMREYEINRPTTNSTRTLTVNITVPAHAYRPDETLRKLIDSDYIANTGVVSYAITD